jgi:hypothetical protein
MTRGNVLSALAAVTVPDEPRDWMDGSPETQ